MGTDDIWGRSRDLGDDPENEVRFAYVFVCHCMIADHAEGRTPRWGIWVLALKP